MNIIQVRGFDMGLCGVNQMPIIDAEIGDEEDDKYIVVENIWNSISQLVYAYISKHNKIFVVRLTLTLPVSYMPSNFSQYIKHFSKNMYRYFKRHYYDPKYIWVREWSGKSIHHHYHFALFLNGNMIQQPHKVVIKANELWTATLGVDITGCVNYDSSLSVRRSEQDFPYQLNELFIMLQYLAKPNTKYNINDGNRNFSCSRI